MPFACRRKRQLSSIGGIYQYFEAQIVAPRFETVEAMSLPLNAEKPLRSIEVKEMRIDTTAAGTRLPAAPDLDVPNSMQSLDTTPPATNGGSTPSSGQTTGTPASTVSSGPIKLPFDAPLPGFLPPPPAELSPEQEKKYRDLLAVVSAWTTVPISNVKDAASTPIQDEERMWLTRECLLRYLRASKWNINEAPKRLHATLIWRREYGVAGLSPDYISPENETGKQVILGYDIAARPCLYLRPGMQNTERSERQIQHLVFMLELVIDLMVPGQDTTTLLCDFKDSGKGSNPTVGQGRQVMTILQGHYPERLGRALISNGRQIRPSTTFLSWLADVRLSSSLGDLGLLQADHSFHRPKHTGEDEI